MPVKGGIGARASGWALPAAALGLAVIVLLACYWQTALSLVLAWAHDGTYQYAFLIFPLSFWTAFGLRHQVMAGVAKPSVWGLVAVGMLVLVWYAGNLLDINLARHVALVGLFPALVLACWGWRATRVLAFPLGYLSVFAVPWGDGLVGPLQDFTARFAVNALGLTGTPALLNGREILTPAATWMVADACSGVKFFIACSALGCLYAYLMYQRWWKRVSFVVLSAVVPVIANGFRVFFTVLIGDTWGLHYAEGTDHMIFGWQFFGTVLVLLLLVGWWFRDPLPVQQQPAAHATVPVGPRAVIWLGVVVVLIAGPVMASGSNLSMGSSGVVQLGAPAVAGWKTQPVADGDWRPVFKGAAGQVQALYAPIGGGEGVGLFHALYTGKPRRGHTLITYGNDVYDPAHARILSSDSRMLDLAGGRRIQVGELRLSRARGSRLVWYWYCVDGRCTRSQVLVKLLQAWDVLRGRVSQSSVWALSAPTRNENLDEVRNHLHAFARALPQSGQPGMAADSADAGGTP